MRSLVVLSVASLVLSGCALAEQKAEAYKQAAERFAYPDKFKICYTRDGDIKQGIEYRCFGESCELPECPNKK